MARCAIWRGATAKAGMAAAQIVITLRGLMDATPEAARDARWQKRRDQIPELVRTAQQKIAETAADQGSAPTSMVWWSGSTLILASPSRMGRSISCPG